MRSKSCLILLSLSAWLKSYKFNKNYFDHCCNKSSDEGPTLDTSADAFQTFYEGKI